MRNWGRWALGAVVTALLLAVPAAYYRATYDQSKRLRVVTPGKIYRCGQLNVPGFEEAFERYAIKTVINLQEDNRDPMLPEHWQGEPAVLESEVCRRNGVQYVVLEGGVLDRPGQDPGSRPQVIDDFLRIMDDPANHPVLIHCKAGLHRTGLITAIYRMEYENRPPAQAVDELLANGFGTFSGTAENVYLDRFILRFEKGVRP